uniref:Aminoacyl-tRNA hydrolase n=1 Tax=Opuntia streptacantha TaxID=393608 RepID=A0A7C8Z8P9_OPUST
MSMAISAPHSPIWYPKTAHFPAGRLRPASFRVSASCSSSLPNDLKGKKLEYTPWLLVGLGNPGTNYHGTRHNVGFEMINNLARRESISLNTIQSKALVAIGSIGEVPVLVAKPQAYMN